MVGGIQTSVTFKSPIAIPGQISDINDCYLITAVCSCSTTGGILPGTYVELILSTNDNEKWIARPPTQTVSSLTDGGIVVYDPMADPYVLKGLGVFTAPAGNGFQNGMPITVMRRGRVSVLTDASVTAGSITMWSLANVNHPSTGTASTPGTFTVNAASTTAGSEVTASVGVNWLRVVDATNKVAEVEVNNVPKVG